MTRNAEIDFNFAQKTDPTTIPCSLMSSGQFMLMDSRNCEEGDTATLGSTYTEVSGLQVLEFAYYTALRTDDTRAALSLHAFYTPDGLLSDRLLTISYAGTDLNSQLHMATPRGMYTARKMNAI